MAASCIGCLAARLQARFHVQLQLDDRDGGFETPAEVPVRGRVVRVFRGYPAVRVGDVLNFSIHVMRDGDHFWFGPSFLLYEKFMKASHMEAFLNGDPPNCELALDEYVTLDAPTSKPQLRASRVDYFIEWVRWKLQGVNM